jgi:ribonuclease P protein component
MKMKIKYRVKTHEDFQAVVRSTTYEKNKTFVVYYLKNEYGHARIGVSAPKKLGNAVVRTTTRRQIRSMIREFWGDLCNIDYVVIVRKNYQFKTFEESKKELNNLFLKIRRKLNEEIK